MISKTGIILCTFLLAWPGSLRKALAGDLKFVPVASYANQPDVLEKEGKRVSTLLNEHKIKSAGAGSAGVTLSVPADHADEARRLLARAIMEEGLRITLVEMNEKGDRALIIAPERVLGELDDPWRTWPSPDHHFALHHAPADNLGLASWLDARLLGGDTNKMQLATYTLTAKDTVLWSAVSSIDESAHSFGGVWAADSTSVLILDHPSRGEVEALLVQTSAPVRGTVLHIAPLIDRVLKQAGDTDDRVTEKPWFGEWRFVDGRFEGIVIVARSHYHRLHLTLDLAAKTPVLSLIDQRTLEDWDDRLGKL